MLSLAPGKVRTSPRAVWVVAPVADLNGGNLPLSLYADDMREQGCKIHAGVPHRQGNTLSCLANVLADPAADASEQVCWQLQRLCQGTGITEVIFPCRGGLGFRAIQAKRAALAFADITLSVFLDDASILRRQAAAAYASIEALQREYAERYAFENADQRLCPLPEPLDAVRHRGWNLHGAGVPSRPRESRPLVTVCLAHYNHGRYLPEALATLDQQTYANVEVLVIDDGSTQEASRAVFAEMERTYPHFRFLRQDNSGIGATRNRGLREAQGEYFVPVDADNIARPDMIERLVHSLVARPDVAALSCYFLAFEKTEDIAAKRFLYACRPTGGPTILGCLRNVYGDANGIYRTEAFRAVGGYETDRGTSFEDWEAYVKLSHAGYRLDVVPEYLFYYRHLPGGFSRTTSAAANHQRVLRQFVRNDWLSEDDREALWQLLAGLHAEAARAAARQQSRRYRLAVWLADQLGQAQNWLPAGWRGSRKNRERLSA